MLSVRQLEKAYPSARSTLPVITGITLEIPHGQFVAIVGRSGSGKSTLLGLMAGMDRPTRGSVSLDGVELSALPEERLAALRNEKIGFVFQSFQLLPTMTAQENVALPLELRRDPSARVRAEELLASVGLAHRYDHLPAQLSGGEQQRVAVARALVGAPRIVFADEPTGNLDATTGATVLRLLESLTRAAEATLVLVTHDPAIAARADRIIELADGAVVGDRFRA